MKAAGNARRFSFPPPVSSPCWRCGVEPRRGAYLQGVNPAVS